MLFLLAAGLTLVFGIMNLINLAHGSMYMLGAYLAATFQGWTDSFVLGVILAVPLTFAIGMAVEMVALWTLYNRDHLDQVLATFGLILFSTSWLGWGYLNIMRAEEHFFDSMPAWPVSSGQGHLPDFTGVTTREEHMGNLQH